MMRSARTTFTIGSVARTNVLTQNIVFGYMVKIFISSPCTRNTDVICLYLNCACHTKLDALSDDGECNDKHCTEINSNKEFHDCTTFRRKS